MSNRGAMFPDSTDGPGPLESLRKVGWLAARLCRGRVGRQAVGHLARGISRAWEMPKPCSGGRTLRI